MSDQPTRLLPPPPVIRARLAEVSRERRELRALLKLSLRASEERRIIRDWDASRLQGGASCA